MCVVNVLSIGCRSEELCCHACAKFQHFLNPLNHLNITRTAYTASVLKRYRVRLSVRPSVCLSQGQHARQRIVGCVRHADRVNFGPTVRRHLSIDTQRYRQRCLATAVNTDVCKILESVLISPTCGHLEILFLPLR